MVQVGFRISGGSLYPVGQRACSRVQAVADTKHDPPVFALSRVLGSSE